MTQEEFDTIKKIKGNVEVTNDSIAVATSCHICGTNVSDRNKRSGERNTWLDLSGLRMHYIKRHDMLGLSLEEVFAMCTKTPISAVDIERILKAQEPLDKNLDMVSVRGIRYPLLSLVVL